MKVLFAAAILTVFVISQIHAFPRPRRFCFWNERKSFPVDDCNRCNPSSECSLVYEYGCNCIWGFTRDDNGVCIPRDRCPRPTDSSSSGETSFTTEQIASTTEEPMITSEEKTTSTKEPTTTS
ncbi:uncharacterized protein TNIN_265521 [Trichonephila inaurata madagascariensis]|uniref:TIL domain-containing protein n=1 Tax=Trichonephila inaurata madagascariensis TaxID=2747483 RepID=A0A8X7C3N3_9ARAC|nr:uncharacterized protein TNIN_265521 [Trichonephila inaurata madagascariensis]